MVSGKRQAVDSAFIKANASMDSLVEKEVLNDAFAFVNELEENFILIFIERLMRRPPAFCIPR